jgi:hypothetical protein
MTVVRDAAHDLVSTLQSFVDAGLWLVIYFVPVMLAMCIPVAILYLLVRLVLSRWQRGSLATRAED